MVSEAKKPAAHCTPPKDSKRKKSYPAAFSKYKFYLDVKSSKVKTTLIEDIIALGGTLLDFLSKEVTHVISESPEWKFLLNSANVSSGPQSPWTPGTTTPSPSTSHDGDKAKKPKSRLENFLDSTRGAAVRTSPSNDILEVARRFRCHIWSLSKTVNWLAKFKAKYGNLCSGGSRAVPRHKERELVSPFIKLTSSVRHARPAIAELKSWPKISIEGWAGTSPFSDQRKQAKRKNLAKRLDLADKNPEVNDCQKKDGGFCEICNKAYTDLERHLQQDLHAKFVKNLSNWTDLDQNIQAGQEKAGLERFLK